MNRFGACLLVIALILKSSFGDADETKIDSSSQEDSNQDRERKSASTLTSTTISDNEIPSIPHDSLPINHYASPPLCYQVHYEEMSETPKIICGKELQQIYLKFNPGLMKNLFVNIYLTEENSSPITIKPIESLDTIYNNTETGTAPYFEPPINPQHAEQFAALKQASEPNSDLPETRAIYYYPEAQKYPNPELLYTRVKIGPNYELQYEKDWTINRPPVKYDPQYDPYAFRYLRLADDEKSMDDSGEQSNLWNEIVKTNKPFVLNCLVSPVSAGLPNSNPFPSPYFSNNKGGGGSGISLNNYNIYSNDINSGFEDYEQTGGSLQQNPPNRIFYNYQELQKLLLDNKKLQKPQTLQNSHLNPPQPLYFTQEEIVNKLPPNFDSSKLRNIIARPRFVRYLDYPGSSEFNSFTPEIDLSSVPNPLRLAPLSAPFENRPSSDNIIYPLSSDPYKSVNYFINKYPGPQFAKPVFYQTNLGTPIVRRYYLKPAPAPIVTSQELFNKPKSLPNFAVLMGYIKPIGFSSDKTQGQKPLTSSDSDKNLSSAIGGTTENGKGLISKMTTEPAHPKKEIVVSSSSKGLDTSLPNTGPEIANVQEAENPETDHVQKKPAALPLEDSDSVLIRDNQEKYLGDITLFRQKGDDDLGQESIFKDYVLNLRNKEKQYEKLIVQSQARIEELQYDLDQLKKGAGKYSRPATPYYNYGVNNNNNPLPPYVPIVQHFTSLNNPFVGNPNPYYPAVPGYPPNLPVPNPLNSFPNPLLQPNSANNIEKASYFNPGIYEKQDENLRNHINMERLNYIGTQAYVDPASIHNLVYSPWSARQNPEMTTISTAIDGESDFINDDSAKTKPKSANIVVVNNVRTTSMNSRGGKNESEAKSKIDGSKIAAGNAERTESSTLTENIENSNSAGIDVTSPTIEGSIASESTTISSNDGTRDAESIDGVAGDGFGGVKKILKSRVLNVKIVEELGMEDRSINRDGVETVTSLEPDQRTKLFTDASSSVSDASSTTGIDELPSSSETPEIRSSPSSEFHSSTVDYIVGAVKNDDIDATVNTVSSSVTESTLSPTGNSTGKTGEIEQQNRKQEQISGKSAVSSSQSFPDSLDPYIEDIVKGIKEKRNYVFDEILQNAVNNNNNNNNSPQRSSSNNESEKTISSKSENDGVFSSKTAEKPDVPVLIEAPLTIVYYPGYREWKSLKKS